MTMLVGGGPHHPAAAARVPEEADPLEVDGPPQVRGGRPARARVGECADQVAPSALDETAPQAQMLVDHREDEVRFAAA